MSCSARVSSANTSPVVASISCRPGNGGYLSHIGFTAEHIIQVLAEERADGVGVNCTLAPAEQKKLLRNIRAALSPGGMLVLDVFTRDEL